MNAAERHQAAKRLFLAACDLQTGERTAMLDRECCDEPELRRLVEAMLSADEGPASALDDDSARAPIEKILDEEADRAASPPPRLPERIGQYRIIRQIGEGGMGAVYEAEQENPRRRVALKVARPHLATTEAVQRLVIEAQVLGHLHHPNIAQVYEAGVAVLDDRGQAVETPFFAMELIDGQPLDVYLREHRPALRTRLALFASICDAVQHAHQKGVVHRDLKPANILVVDRDPSASGTAEPAAAKILDFGVARLMRSGLGEGGAPPLADLAVHTSAGQLVGTLSYMSPEQVAGRAEDIDARTDIYALGVILYEILAGRPPLDIRNMPLAEAARAIEHRDPAPLGAVDPALRGDPETIVAKAMAKAPADRYASAAALADDVRRCLRDEPITARPPSTLYQFRKFARRNRGVVMAASIALVAVVVGFGATAVEAVALARANALERQARWQAQEREAEAKSEAAKSRAVTDFLQEMLASADPGEGPNDPGITLVELLDTAAERLDAGSLADQPAVDVAIRTALGNTYRALARYEEALAHLQHAAATGARLYPGGHEDLSYALNKLSRTYLDIGDYENGERYARETLDMRLRLYGEEHVETATALNNLAYVYFRRANYDEAEQLYQRCLAVRRTLLGDEDEQTASVLNNIALLKFTTGDYAAAEPLFRESLEVDQRARGADHPHIAITMTNLAAALREQGKLDESLALLGDAIAMMTRLHGENHPLTARLVSVRGRTLHLAGRLEEAEADLRESLATLERIHGASHPTFGPIMTSLARLRRDRGDHAEAIRLYSSALEIHRSTEGEHHPNTFKAAIELAEALIALDRSSEAARILQTARAAAEEAGESAADHLTRIEALAEACIAPQPASGDPRAGG